MREHQKPLSLPTGFRQARLSAEPGRAKSRILESLEMKRMQGSIDPVMFATALAAPLLVLPGAARAAEDGGGELNSAAQALAKQYDENYNAKNAAGMAALYAVDGTLVTPGPVVTGREALQKYYQARFDAGASDHHMTVKTVQMRGDVTYGIGEVRVMAPFGPEGKLTQMHGNVVWLYQHESEGWKYRLVTGTLIPSK